MAGKFLGGVLIGGMVGAAIASQWDLLAKNCPFFAEIKSELCPKKKSQAKTTRLMARRNRMAN